ncbi:MAG: YggS family pyridoxal phosphate-dependent enzyme [Lachnospiraceae bacterium]|nr:YggS family pyridoxal phosphate-dependent enzyme [Lachnospiraceae bacterium]
MNSIERNIEEVRNNIIISAKKAGRNPSDTVLIAVSKTKPVEDMLDAYNAGIRDFGENKVQEILEKYDSIPKDARFHMIGHLQKNKVKYIVDKVCLIHSVDSFELAEVIERESLKRNLTTDILIEVNIAGEESKFGVRPEDTLELCQKISKLPHVRVRGLMTVAPYVENPEDNRQYFVGLRQLGIDINSQNIDNIYIEKLSMGMSKDYCIAAEEGAGFVRVGTDIFGERNYNTV